MASEKRAEDVLISIVVPTYNEEKDIHETLEALVRLSHPSKEIIVVDDSTDSTPSIVRQYENHGVKLIRRDSNRDGRSGARNFGIRAARGNIVVILNADVLLPSDFIERILRHYDAGYDYVLVESRVKNDQYLFPRFVQAIHRRDYEGQDWIEWTEGFSCRREAALEAGLFPEGLPIPLPAGEDAVFARKLSERFRKKIDRSIVVLHNVPSRFVDYWRNRKDRTKPYVHYFVNHMPLWVLLPRILIKTIFSVLWFLLLVPWLVDSWCLGTRSPRGLRDFPYFLYCSLITRAAMVFGEWEGFFAIARLVMRQV